MEELVSVIMPCYNSEKYISDAISSVINQTYLNWELLVIDDCSTDSSSIIIKEFEKKDSRVQYFRTNISSGSPAFPRNIGIEKARGKYIAFLDSDDLWFPDKLKQQCLLFNGERIAIVYSNYEKINEDGVAGNRIIKAIGKVDYKKLLKGNVIACSTAIYDVSKVNKVFFIEHGHEDYIFWLSILKKGYIAKNTNTVEVYYRVRKNSISSNKFKAILWIWDIYTDIENLSFFQSLYCINITLFKSFLKFLK